MHIYLAGSIFYYGAAADICEQQYSYQNKKISTLNYLKSKIGDLGWATKEKNVSIMG